MACVHSGDDSVPPHVTVLFCVVALGVHNSPQEGLRSQGAHGHWDQNYVQSPSCNLQLHTGKACPQEGPHRRQHLGLDYRIHVAVATTTLVEKPGSLQTSMCGPLEKFLVLQHAAAWCGCTCLSANQCHGVTK